MGFIHPQLLWLIVLLLPLMAIATFVRRRREARLELFTVRENWPILNRQVSTRARFHKAVLVFLALSFSIVAAARPYWGVQEREVARRGTNIIFAVDVSKSMLANDVMPNRLEYARLLIRQILVETRGNRVGLMPFAGEAFLQCPLTDDYGIVQDVLKHVTTNSISYEGTNIPDVIDQSIAAFERIGGGTRAIVVLTDGEDHTQELLAAARKAADNGIRIFAVGIGTQEGAAIRMPDGSFLSARDGTKVLSRMNPDILMTLADATNGRAYISPDTGRFDPTPLIRDLNNLENEELDQAKRVVRQERFQWPLGLAILCLFVEGLLGDRRRRLSGGVK